MPDTKISALASGSPAQAADVFPIARAGANFKLANSDLATLFGVVIGAFTFATLPAASANSGLMARVTDIGPATAGSFWISNGTVWKPLNGCVLIVPNVTRTSVAGGGVETATNLQFQFPANFFNVGDRIRLYANLSKGGVATTGTVRVRMGTAGTTGDTQIITSITALGTANQSAGAIIDFTIASATQTMQAGSPSFANGSYGSSASAYAAAVTISNVNNALFVTLTILPGLTDAVALENGVMEYYSA